jgi:hypothetical protein
MDTLSEKISVPTRTLAHNIDKLRGLFIVAGLQYFRKRHASQQIEIRMEMMSIDRKSVT